MHVRVPQRVGVHGLRGSAVHDEMQLFVDAGVPSRTRFARPRSMPQHYEEPKMRAESSRGTRPTSRSSLKTPSSTSTMSPTSICPYPPIFLEATKPHDTVDDFIVCCVRSSSNRAQISLHEPVMVNPELLDQEIDEQRRDLRTDKLDITYGELASMYQDKELLIDPEYQRLFRWGTPKKSGFIESLLLGIPTPAIFVAETDKGVWELVDGLQRISTMLEFMGVLRTVDNEIVPQAHCKSPGEQSYHSSMG